MIETKKTINEFLTNEPPKKYRTEKIIRILFLLMMFLFIGIGIYTYNLLDHTKLVFEEVVSIRNAIFHLNEINIHHANKYTSARAFNLTSESKYFDQYYEADLNIKNHLDSVSPYLNEHQLLSYYNEIKGEIDSSDKISDTLIQVTQQGLKHDSNSVKSIRDRLDGTSGRVQADISRSLGNLGNLLQSKINERSERLQDSSIAFAILFVFGTFTLTISLFFFAELTRARNKAYNLLRNSYEELDHIVLERTKELENVNNLLIKEIQTRVEGELLLRESEERFRVMAESAPAMIWMSGPDKKNNYFNKTWYEFTGRTYEQEIGDGWIEGIHPDDVKKFLKEYHKAFDERKVIEKEYRLKNKNGEYKWVLDRSAPRFQGDTFLGYIGITIDIQEMKTIERYTKTQYSVSKVLTEADTLERALRQVLDSIVQGIGWEFGILWTVDSKMNNLKPAAITQTTNVEYSALHDYYYTFERGFGLPGEVWDRGEPQWIENIKNSKVFIRDDAFNKLKFNTVFAIPITNGNDVIAVIECFNKAFIPVKPDLLEVLDAVGRQIGNYIERKRAEELLKESYVDLEDRVKDRTVELANTLTKLLTEIEEKERIQNKLKLFAHSVKSIKEAVYITDLSNKTIFINEAFEQLLGYNEVDILGKSLPLLDPKYINKKLTEEIMVNTLKGGWRGEFEIPKKDHNLFVHLSTSIIRNEEGKIEAVIGILQDITSNKQTEALIEKRNSLLNLLNDVIKFTNKTFDIENSIAYTLTKVCTHTAWTVGHCYKVEDGHLKSMGIWNENLPKNFEAFKQVSMKNVFKRKEGLAGKCWDEARPLWVRAVDFENDKIFTRAEIGKDLKLQTGVFVPIMKQNEVVGVLEYFNTKDMELDYEIMDCLDNISIELGNIFERVDILNKITESESRYKSLAETANDAIITTDRRGNVIYFNQAALKIFHFTYEELMNYHLPDLITVEYRKKFMDFFRTITSTEVDSSNNTMEMCAYIKGGGEFPIEISLAHWTMNDQIYYTAMVRDITSRKNIEKQLVDKQKLLEDAQHIAKLGSWEWDVNNNKFYWSDEMYKIYEIEDVNKIPTYEEFSSFNHPDDSVKTNEIIQNALKNNEPFSFYHKIITAKGNMKIIKSQGEILNDKEKNSTRVFGTGLDVTEVRLAEEKIINSERQLKEAQAIAKMGSFEWIVKENKIVWSDEMYNIFEVDKNVELTNDFFNKYIDAEDMEYINKVREKAFVDRKPFAYEFKIKTENGIIKYLTTHSEIQVDSNDDIYRVFGTIMDITDIKLKDERIRESEKQLKDAQRIAKLGSFTWVLETDEITYSEEFARIFDVESDQKVSREILSNHILPEDKDRVLNARDEALKNKKPYHSDYRIITFKGNIKNISAHGELVINEKGVVEKMVGTVMDITDLKQAEEQIRKREGQLKEAQHIAKLGNFEWNILTNEISYSDEIFNIYEINKDEEPSMQNNLELRSRVHPDDVEMLDKLGQKLLADKLPVQVTYRLYSKDGSLKYLYAESVTEFDKDNNPIRVYGNLQDVTMIKKAEEIIRRSEKQLKEAQRITRLGSFEWDLETGEQSYSDEIYRIYELEKGKSRPSPLDPEVSSRIHEEDRERVKNIFEKIVKKGKTTSFNFRYYSNDGSVKYLYADALVENDKNNKPARVFGSLQDITSIKLVEEELRKTNEKLLEAQRELIHNEKLAALGRFSSGIAHEIRNPLANISALTQLLNQADLDPRLKKHIDFILKNVDIANKIIKDLLDFAQKDETEFQFRNIVSILSDILDLVKTRCESNNIELIKEFDNYNIIMPVNEKKLHSSFMNFISNAIEAMPKGGKLHVKSRLDVDVSRFIIDIKDTGIGIPKENLDKIFEPFFTTKDTGSGLGMAIAYQGVQLHNGEIDIDSEPNKGTNITIQFPINNN